MPVLIKKIDPELYTKFKAKAIEQGLKIDEAFTEAVRLWLTNPHSLSQREQLQQKNEIAFRILRNQIEKEYPNKWLSIIDGKIAAFANSREELFVKLREIKKNADPSLIYHVSRKLQRTTLGIKQLIKG